MFFAGLGSSAWPEPCSSWVSMQKRSKQTENGGWEKAATLLRSMLSGGAATVVDLLVLGALIEFAHVHAAIANVPAACVGALVSFWGHRSFAFRSMGPWRRQLALFLVVEAGTLALNAGIFFLLTSRVPLFAQHYMLTRLLLSNIVYLAWSFPLWRLVFVAKPLRVKG